MHRRHRLSAHSRSVLQERGRAKRGLLTRSEEALWQRIRRGQLGVVFRRQVVIAGYIVDFAATAARLVVEVDGGWHAGREPLDARRDRRLACAGYRVLRLPAALVLEAPERAVELVRGAVRVSDVPRPRDHPRMRRAWRRTYGHGRGRDEMRRWRARTWGGRRGQDGAVSS